jgi:hypothetical protein
MIQLRFIQQEGIEDNIIRWCTRSEWTHVEIILPNDEGFISSYTPKGVQIMPPALTANGTVAWCYNAPLAKWIPALL